MRLTCPNCGAQYEVPDEVIPLEGRDVQCSNCGNTWYQPHPENPDTIFAQHAEPAEGGLEPDLAEIRAAVTDEPVAAQTRAPAPEPQDVPPARQEMDRSVSEILQEEARREAQLRAAEAGGLESQPELGLDSARDDDARSAQQAQSRMTQIRGETPEKPDLSAETGSRRGLLPDIEEINSTLRSSSESLAVARGGVPAALANGTGRRTGFSRGFVLALLLGVILVLIYVNAPRIAQSVPGADPMLSAYVALVDQGRIWLDAKLGTLIPN